MEFNEQVKVDLEVLAKIFDKDFAGNAAILRRAIARIQELERDEARKARKEARERANLHEF